MSSTMTRTARFGSSRRKATPSVRSNSLKVPQVCKDRLCHDRVQEHRLHRRARWEQWSLPQRRFENAKRTPTTLARLLRAVFLELGSNIRSTEIIEEVVKRRGSIERIAMLMSMRLTRRTGTRTRTSTNGGIYSCPRSITLSRRSIRSRRI